MDNKIKEAINQFYKLKNDYDEQFYEKYVQKIVVSKQSKREKKAAFAALPKPKCINCKRNVSTIFSIKQDENEKNLHIYSAQCGDIMNPCPLKIKILMTNTTSFEKLLDDHTSSSGIVNSLKIQIIKAKNDLLFGYLQEKEAFQIFENLTSELKEQISTYDFFLEKYIEVYDSQEKRTNLQSQKVDFEMKIQELKNTLAEFNETKNMQLIHSAVDFYINQILPQAKEIRNLTYAYNNVELIDNHYVLLQQKNTLDQLEITRDDSKIESFIVGMKKPVKAVKTIKNKELTTKNKTKKIKPVLVLTEEPEQLEEIKEEEQNKNENNI